MSKKSPNLNRRQFICASLATGAGLALPRGAAGQSVQSKGHQQQTNLAPAFHPGRSDSQRLGPIANSSQKSALGCTTWVGDPPEWLDRVIERRASWITLPGGAAAMALDRRYFLARRDFTVRGTGSMAVLQIAADSDYRVYLNGAFVGSGQTRDTVVRVPYHTYIVTDLIRSGENCVAVEVYGSRQAVLTGRTGLIAAVALQTGTGGRQEWVSDPTWRVTPGTCWDGKAEEMDSYFRQTEVYDMRLVPEGWTEPAFDASGWAPAAVLDHQERFSEYGPSYRPHTQLVPAIVPPVARTFVRPWAIARLAESLDLGSPTPVSVGLNGILETLSDLQFGSVLNAEQLLTSASAAGAPCEVMNTAPAGGKTEYYNFWDKYPGEMPAVRDTTIIFDFGEQTYGHLLIEVAALGGEVIDFAWGQVLIGNRVHSKLYAPNDSYLFGNMGQASRLITRPGVNLWESFHPVPVRYLQVTFRNLEAPLRISRLGLIQTTPPLDIQGKFNSSSETLNWSWAACARTLIETTQDVYVDNFIRENGTYTGECGGNALATTQLICGESRTARHWVGMITAHPETQRFLTPLADAWIQAKFEADDRRVSGVPFLFHHPLRMMYAMAEYALTVSDVDWVKAEVYPTIARFIEWSRRVRNEAGLVQSPPGWNWFDWADVDCDDGELAPQSLLLRSLLIRAAAVAAELGDHGKAADYQNQAHAIAEQIRTRFWSDAVGAYVDSIVKGQQQTRVFSEHTNFQALGAGLGQGGRKNRILQVFKKRSVNVTESDTAFMDIVLNGLFECGEAKYALEIMERRYNRFRLAGLDTLCEEFSPFMSMRRGRWAARYRSITQSAACAPCAILARKVLGVEPTGLAFRRCRIAPNLGSLEHAEGAIPTPHGLLEVAVRARPNELTLRLDIPSGVEAEVALPPGARFRVDGVSRDPSDPRVTEVLSAVGTGRHEFTVINPRER